MSNTNIFIDTSYLVYYVGFSSWLQYSHGDNSELSPDFDPMSKNYYKEIFERTFRGKIFGTIKKHTQEFDTNKIVFCLDCKRKNIWRNEVFDTYKEDRGNVKHKFNWNGIFNHVKEVLIPMYEMEGMKVVQYDSAEGDDIIAICVDYEAKKGNENLVIASDKDLWQLLDRCSILNLKGKAPDIEMSPKKFLLCKILTGDKSDSIPGVFPRCGEKTALKLLEDNEKFKEKLSDKEVKERFLRNRKIIDFQYIPENIRNNVINEWELVNEV